MWSGFIFGTDNFSSFTHNLLFLHLFYSYYRTFHGIPLTVENLGDTAQSDYKFSPSLSANSSTGVYTDIINQYRWVIIIHYVHVHVGALSIAEFSIKCVILLILQMFVNYC